MSDYRFGDDYKLSIYPKDAMDCWGEIDIDKVEAVEIDCVDFVRKPDDKSRWFELFGTHERAAQTLAKISCDGFCESCVLYGAHCDYDGNAQLEWLRGDAE